MFIFCNHRIKLVVMRKLQEVNNFFICTCYYLEGFQSKFFNLLFERWNKEYFPVSVVYLFVGSGWLSNLSLFVESWEFMRLHWIVEFFHVLALQSILIAEFSYHLSWIIKHGSINVKFHEKDVCPIFVIRRYKQDCHLLV